eukprot:scaffold1648_cov115-Cylindrotheca_fusiformis.AAC.6
MSGKGVPNDPYCVDLPQGVIPEEFGFTLSGSPPTVSMLTPGSPLEGKIQIGHYIHCIRLNGLEIVNLVDCNHLMSVLRANTNYPRQLLCSAAPVYVDPMVGGSPYRPLFKHGLPASAQLGFALTGFPPVIAQVDKFLEGRLFVGQTVEALWIPGRPLMNLQAGGFSSAKVNRELAATSNIEGRKLTVRDGQTAVPNDPGSTAGCDDICTIS